MKKMTAAMDACSAPAVVRVVRGVGTVRAVGIMVDHENAGVLRAQRTNSKMSPPRFTATLFEPA